MSLSEEDIKAVVFYRKEKAYATLREAEDMIAIKHWNLAMQRMYYACFYMASALLVSAGFKSQTHESYWPYFFFLYELQILGYPKDPVRHPVLSGGACRG